MNEELYLKYLIENFLKEFNNLINKDIYISKKSYNIICSKYEYLFKNINKVDNNLCKNIDLTIKKHNDDFINQKLILYKNYFDNIFKNIDSNIKLDDEQRKVLLSDEDYSLLIAGAGSGKTTTMSAKVKYLIEKCNINPSSIIVMSFTKKATEELNEKINKEFKLGAKVTTFHKLGMEILKGVNNNNLKVIDDKTKYLVLKKIFLEKIFKNKKLFKDFNKYFNNYLSFDRKSYKYLNYDDYYSYYIKKKYKKEKGKIKEFNESIVNDRLKNLISINGEHLKDLYDVKIANFLYKLNIPYKYVIDLNELNKSIKYFSVFSDDANIGFLLDEDVYYDELYKYKNFLNIIFNNKRIYENIIRKLKKSSLIFNTRTNKEIFIRLMQTSMDNLFSKFLFLSITFITKFKENNYCDNDIDILKGKTNDSIVKNQLDLIKIVVNYYNTLIHNDYKIDFEDMINYACCDISKYKELNKNVNYSYLIIDEYQDVSFQKYNFIKKISDTFNSKIIAVGDDWQSIYGFSGSKISLFTDFDKLFGYSKIIKITKTYRNSQELIDVAGNFVCKNTNQYKKNLVSNKHLENPIEINYYDNNKIEVINNIINNIYLENKTSKILLLGRYNSDINDLLESKYFKKGIDNKIICNSCSNSDISFLTVHASKGLGFDEVILINAIDDIHGFPSKIKNDDLISVFDSNILENIAYPEERRLFYVALTRTKNKVYIVTPIKNPSIFINEISNNQNVIQKFC
ncbi:MAG: UvrD-helicase domain-containing protein [Clostridium sp.]|nr:UvrD-helicase domain-containing protein [Clostridium sp.]MCM1443847.1 UvrD-helicase domain-containing protein [Candidatus Amulumruptor caecigallinarius]